MTKTMRERCNNKPSAALRAMVAGLEKASRGELPNFKVGMGTYGMPSPDVPGICFGCAATCAVQELTGHVFTADDYKNYLGIIDSQSLAIGCDADDLREFEYSIDNFREGYPLSLLRYFNVPTNILPDVLEDVFITLYCEGQFSMSTGDYQDKLPIVRMVIEHLEDGYDL